MFQAKINKGKLDLLLARARSDEQDHEAQQNKAKNVSSQVKSSGSSAGFLIEPQTRGRSDI